MNDTLLDQNNLGGDAANFDQRWQEVQQRGFQVDIGGWIRKAWEVFQKEPGYFIGLVILTQGLSMLVQLIGNTMGDFIGILVSVGVAFALLPMNMGYAILARKILNNESYSFSDMFGGYKMTGELIVVYLLYAVMVAIGLVLLVLPGFYLAIAMSWGPYILLFYGKGAYESLDISRKMIHKSWWGMFGFMIVAGLLLNIAGLLVCLVGVLVSLPVSYIAFYVALHETLGLNEGPAEGQSAY